MAVLDPRLLDLINTLVKTRLDWLAFELAEGIQAGRPPEESEEALAAARKAVQSNEQPKVRGEPQVSASVAVPIEGDEQVEWAVAYVGDRIATALAQLEASIESLDLIIDGSPLGDRGATRVTTGSVSVFTDDATTRKTGRDDIIDARASITALRSSLAKWSAQVRGEATP